MALSHLILGLSLAYLGLLFAVAHIGERLAPRWSRSRLGALIYALSLAIYCTSWTFYGSVGRAVTSGLDFALIYVGPTAVIIFALPLMRRMVTVAKRQNVTSIADFLGARYGRSRGVAVLATLIAVIGAMPYLALQLQAVSFSFAALAGEKGGIGPMGGGLPNWLDTAFVVALMMAAFTILFGVRHVQASEQHRGMMLAIGMESLVKLFAFLAAGIFVVWHMFDGPADLIAQTEAISGTAKLATSGPNANWLAITALSGFAFLCLDRQFHVAVVEHDHPASLKTARWLFPLYLLLINAFVVPIAMAGVVHFQGGGVPDIFVLSLPLSAGADWLTAFVFIGGLSAATSMVAVACMALSGMIGNELVMPFLLRRRHGDADLGRLALLVRRLSVVAILLAAYIFYRNIAGLLSLATIGLISFCAVANLAPALILGLYWRQTHRTGAILGMVGGFSVWLWAILWPTLQPGEASFLPPIGPLAAFEPLQRGFLTALVVNLVLLILGSLLARQTERDTQQAAAFIDEAADGTRLPVAPPKDEQLQLRELAARFIGNDRADEAFRDLNLSGGAAAEFTERLLSGTIGAASARVVVTMARRKSPWPTAWWLPGWMSGSVREMLNEATTAIRYNADVLRKTLDHMGLGIAVFDSMGRLEVWNERFAALIGLPPDSLSVGVDVAVLATQVPALRDLQPPDPQPITEFRLPNDDVTELRVDPLSGGGIVVTAGDVTERVRAAEALRDSERRTRIVTDNVPVLIAYVDREQRYRFTNRPYEAALRLRPQEAAGRRVDEMLGPMRYARLRSYIERALAGEPQSFEIDFPTNDAKIEVAQGSYIPHLDEQGRVLGFFLLYVDTTERRRSEAALRNINESLERRVTQRTAELETARARAEEANIGKTRFVAAASHDLLQPLHAVRLFAAALAERYRGDELVGKVDLGLGAVEALLDALLDIAKLDAGAIRPEKRPTPVGPLLQSLADAFAPVAKQNGIALRLVPTAAWADTDPALLRRVLQNYLSNAIRYGRGGTRPRVLLGCRRSGEALLIEVRDNGPGIPEHQQAMIFQEFTRLRATDDAGERGLGLGLAIVDRIASMLGHTRHLRSIAGKGAAFSIAVPLAVSAADDRAAPAADEARSGTLSRAPFVACIDDSAQVLDGMTALLESWGCTVATAPDADHLLVRLAGRTERPDLLLIDLHLGDDHPDGIQELTKLRTAWGLGIPVALITADRDPSVAARARALGLDILLKPVKPAKLRALIAHLNVRSVA